MKNLLPFFMVLTLSNLQASQESGPVERLSISSRELIAIRILGCNAIHNKDKTNIEILYPDPPGEKIDFDPELLVYFRKQALSLCKMAYNRGVMDGQTKQTQN